MPHNVLFCSPHLDDAVFSAGGTIARLADLGYDPVVATLFTRSVVMPTGFALQCQLDKGLPADVDYMAIRRAEDVDALGVLNAGWVHCDLPEAPHRGYNSARELFLEPRSGDDIAPQVTDCLESLLARYQPVAVFAPQCLGRHVDHVQVLRALVRLRPAGSVVWWRDVPYAVREPGAVPDGRLAALRSFTVNVAKALGRKIEASARYASQVGFQFGSAGRLREQLTGFAQFEAQTTAQPFWAESFLGVAPELPGLVLSSHS